jgi:hypothetical protein
LIERAVEAQLLRLRGELRDAAVRHLRRRRRRNLALLAAIAAGGLGTGVGLGSSGWLGRDVTPEDVRRQATVVTNDRWSECGVNGCVTKTGTHEQVQILPAMGVSFVFPSGDGINIVPALALFGGPTFLSEERARLGLPGLLRDGTRRSGTVRLTQTGGAWVVDLGEGRTRTISWRRREGSMLMADRDADGEVTVTRLHAGDVVELVPGSIDPQARTLEKAVAFDLPSGVRVFVLPGFNETYVGYLPSMLPPATEGGPLGGGVPLFRPRPPVIARAEAERWGLTPDGAWNARLPTREGGGEWNVVLPDGTRRTISWDEGDGHVTVRDDKRELEVPVGHELPLVPFR